MAESEAIIGYGTTLEYGNASTGPWTKLAEVVNVPPPSPEVSDVEVTHMESPDRYMEFIPGLVDPGEFECEMNYRADTHEFFFTNIGEKYYFRITLPDGSTFVFYGYIKAVPSESEINDKLTFSATIKISGAITPSYAS